MVEAARPRRALFVVARTAQLIDGRIAFGETHLFVGRGYVVSVTHPDDVNLDAGQGRVGAGAPHGLRADVEGGHAGTIHLGRGDRNESTARAKVENPSSRHQRALVHRVDKQPGIFLRLIDVVPHRDGGLWIGGGQCRPL